MRSAAGDGEVVATVTDPSGAASASTLRERTAATLAWQEAIEARPAIAAALTVAGGAPPELVETMGSSRRILLAGAGSSYHVAQLAASAMRQVAALPAVAVPLSDLLLRPADVLASGDRADQPVVVVSRSGSTTEAVDAVRSVREQGQYALAVTCRPGSPMTALASATLSVSEADERAIVMTRSVAALSTLLMALGARLADPSFARALEELPARWPETAPFVARAFELAAAGPARVVVLGGGAAYGLACEAVLKLTETSRIPASAYQPLEFRHGPISVCEPGVLVVGLLGDAEDVERRVLDECEHLGATTWTLGPQGPGRELGEVARLPLMLHPLQALAFAIAWQRGLDPDRPRHLGQVVVLHDG